MSAPWYFITYVNYLSWMLEQQLSYKIHVLDTFLFLTAVDCGTLPKLPNGKVSHTGRTTFGETATYSCDRDYSLVGDSTRMCQDNGLWSGSAPTCQYTFFEEDIFCT